MRFSAGEQWDQLLEVANDFARIDIRGEQEISEEEDEERDKCGVEHVASSSSRCYSVGRRRIGRSGTA